MKKFSSSKLVNGLCTAFAFVGMVGISRACTLFGFHEPEVSNELLEKYD